jgi:hypothetical protein
VNLFNKNGRIGEDDTAPTLIFSISAFLMKDLVLLAVSFYLLKQDVMRVSLPAQRVAPDWLERVGHQHGRGAA